MKFSWLPNLHGEPARPPFLADRAKRFLSHHLIAPIYFSDCFFLAALDLVMAESQTRVPHTRGNHDHEKQEHKKKGHDNRPHSTLTSQSLFFFRCHRSFLRNSLYAIQTGRPLHSRRTRAATCNPSRAPRYRLNSAV